MTTKASKIFLFFTAFAIISVLAILVFKLLGSSFSTSSVSLPKPNGYVDLVTAAHRVASASDGSGSDNRQTRPLEELRVLVSQNVDALKLARSGLNKECRVTTDFSTNSTVYMTGHLLELTALKSLARAFVMEGELAEMEHRTNDAVRSYLDAMRLGNESGRGGLLIDRLVGLAFESMGSERLSVLLGTLDLQQCRIIIKEAELIQEKRESADETLRNEKEWARKAMGWRSQIVNLLRPGLMKPARDKFVQKHHDRERQTNKLLLDAAIRASQLEKGAPPKNLAALVPEYLRSLPADAATIVTEVPPATK